MREEIFNITRQEFDVYEYSDTNLVEYKTEQTEDIFGIGFSSYHNTSPWGHFSRKDDYKTEEKYLEHYNNPLSTISITRRIMCITKEDDKISFKMFWYHRRRRLQSKWFKTNTNCKFITFNFKTNALYIGSLENYHLKRKCKKRISRSLFNCDPINKMRMWIRDSYTSEEKKLIDVTTILNQVVTLFVNSIPGTEKYPELLPEQKFYKRYLDYQGIKYPNNWFELMEVYPQPKKKDLVKCNYKYIDALMKVHNLKGDKIKRILHNVDTFKHSLNYHKTCEIFGEKFILNQPDEVVSIFLSVWDVSTLPKILTDIKLSKSEKLKFFEIYKLYYKKKIDYHTICDHIRFYCFLKNIEPIKWESKTHDEFTQEHFMWSEKYGHYTNGKFTRIYNPNFIKFINEVIITKYGLYFPEILLTSERYNEESLFQSNCVKTYIKRADSLLISLRRGIGDTEERASIEYRIIPMNWDNGIEFNLERVQTLGKYNQNLDSSWEDALVKLDERISIMVYEKIFDTLQIEGEIGGEKVFSNYSVTERERKRYGDVIEMITDTYLKWENNSIMKINSYNLNVPRIQHWGDDNFPL